MAKKTVYTKSEDEPKGSYPTFNLHDLRHDKEGREHLDPVPLQPPLGYNKQPSLTETIRAMVRQQARLEKDNDPETFEEADDFEIEEDMDPHSRWENDFEPSIKELKARYEARLAEEAAAEAAASTPPALPESGTPPARPPGADPSP